MPFAPIPMLFRQFLTQAWPPSTLFAYCAAMDVMLTLLASTDVSGENLETARPEKRSQTLIQRPNARHDVGDNVQNAQTRTAEQNLLACMSGGRNALPKRIC